MWIKLISIWKASHQDSLWNRSEKQLGNRLLNKVWKLDFPTFSYYTVLKKIPYSGKGAIFPVNSKTCYLSLLGHVEGTKGHLLYRISLWKKDRDTLRISFRSSPTKLLPCRLDHRGPYTVAPFLVANPTQSRAVCTSRACNRSILKETRSEKRNFFFHLLHICLLTGLANSSRHKLLI